MVDITSVSARTELNPLSILLNLNLPKPNQERRVLHQIHLHDRLNKIPVSTSRRLRSNTAQPIFGLTQIKSYFFKQHRLEAFNPSSHKHSQLVRIVLDSGSQRSYVTDRVARRLSLKSDGKQSMTVMTFGSSVEQSHVSSLVKLDIALKNGQTEQLNLLTVPLICEPISSQPVTLCQDTFDHIVDLDLADPVDGCSQLDVDILIGSDQYWSLATGKTLRGSKGPTAIETRLGWVLSGPAPTNGLSHHSFLTTTHVLKIGSPTLSNEQDSLEELLQSFWDFESIGITGREKTLYDDFCDTVTTRDGRYEVSLPWMETHRPLPDNYLLSFKRLQSLLRRLRQSPDLLHQLV